MLLSQQSFYLRRRRILITAALIIGVLWILGLVSSTRNHEPDLATLKSSFPLTWKHVHSFRGAGGAWYIPDEWIDADDVAPQSIVEAARIATKAASSNPKRLLPYSKIPRIVHQTAQFSRMDTWNPSIFPWVEKWLRYSVSSKRDESMAYFFWDDNGIEQLVKEMNGALLDDMLSIFTPVERADIFRIFVCQEFGGIYADVDTEPLRHPATWIAASDISLWTDDMNGEVYGVGLANKTLTSDSADRPVHLLWGLEADLDPDSDSYWRMGYAFPVQITQWALASSGSHPVLSQFVHNLKGHIREAKQNPNDAKLADPLVRTGPAAVTLATKNWLEEETKFRWNALTGLHDGGKSKLVLDVLVLPMTGFSPGRGKYGNMGSKPISHPDARLCHHGLGSWKHFNVGVELGKLCRTAFGLCKDWSKVAFR